MELPEMTPYGAAYVIYRMHRSFRIIDMFGYRRCMKTSKAGPLFCFKGEHDWKRTDPDMLFDVCSECNKSFKEVILELYTGVDHRSVDYRDIQAAK